MGDGGESKLHAAHYDSASPLGLAAPKLILFVQQVTHTLLTKWVDTHVYCVCPIVYFPVPITLVCWVVLPGWCIPLGIPLPNVSGYFPRFPDVVCGLQ